jgi:urease accessory protein
MMKQSTRGASGRRALALLGLTSLAVTAALPAQAHHAMELFHWKPTAVNGLISGLLHPVLGPDHLLFLLALSLVGLRHRSTWMLGLLAVGLAGSGMGLLVPGLPGAEVLVALSLVVVALVLSDRLPRFWLLPAFALHGYVLSASVLGWTAMPVAAYLVGLLLSQGLLLFASLRLLAAAAAAMGPQTRRALALAVAGVGALLALVPLLA